MLENLIAKSATFIANERPKKVETSWHELFYLSKRLIGSSTK